MKPGALLFALLPCACGSEDDPAALPEGCDHAIAPDDDVRDAQRVLIEAAEGETVCFLEGTFSYDMELSVGTNDLSIRGAGMVETVLDFVAQQTGGTGANGISITGDRVTVEALSIVDTDGDGVRATDVTDVAFRDLSVSWTTPADRDNGGYGVYPVGCTGVLVERCAVSGASDTGIYVGQSTDVIVRDNEVFENVVGIEIENTRDSEVVRNRAHDNAGGILAFNLPNLPTQGGARAKIHDNEIVGNNGRNFADSANIVSKVPPGTGIFLLATDDNEIHGNVIADNASIGVSILSYDPKLFGEFTDSAYDSYPTGNWVHDNDVSNNGTDADGLVEILFADQEPFPDLSWDGCENPDLDNSDGRYTNCFSDNGDADYFFMDWCGGKAAQHNDMTDVTCEHDPLPALEE